MLPFVGIGAESVPAEIFFTVQIFQKEADMYMKEMIPKDDYGNFVDSKDTARVDSMFVAKFFEKKAFSCIERYRKS